MKRLKQLTATVAIGFMAMPVQAQSIGPATLNATGGTVVTGTNELEWSVGEMTMVSTFTNAGIIVTQGLLQPEDMTEGVVNNSLLMQDLQVFPNPASDVVNLQYTALADGVLTYKLLDMGGKVILTNAIHIKQGMTREQINVSGVACATYMLDVTVNSVDAVKGNASYKIEKL